jgi:hypothetical protein
VTVFLNGNGEPEISGNVRAAPNGSKRVFIAGDAFKVACFEGRIDEVAIYGRALSTEEIRRHYQGAGAIAMNPQ